MVMTGFDRSHIIGDAVWNMCFSFGISAHRLQHKSDDRHRGAARKRQGYPSLAAEILALAQSLTAVN